MSIGDDIAAALPGLRAEAESRMTETVTVGLFRDETDDSGAPVRVLVEERYTGVGRVRWASRGVTNANGPAMPVTVQEPYLSIPHGSARLFDRDEVHVIDSTSDPILVGRKFAIQGGAIAGQVSAHRYPLTELG